MRMQSKICISKAHMDLNMSACKSKGKQGALRGTFRRGHVSDFGARSGCGAGGGPRGAVLYSGLVTGSCTA